MRNRKSEVTNVDVVLWALAQAGGVTRKVHSEEIAAEAHSTAPDRFSWQMPKYRERGWPDKYIVKTALEDAKKQESGGLVTGDYANDLAKDGWTLTSRGARWITDNAERLQKSLGLEHDEFRRLPRRERTRFLKKIEESQLFKLFKAGSFDSATPYLFTDMLTCSPDAPVDTVSAKFDRLKSLAELTKAEHISDFLCTCAERFADLLGTSGKAN